MTAHRMSKVASMLFPAKVVGGEYVNSTIELNRRGDLTLRSQGFRRTPNLTIEAVASWEELFPEARGATAAVRNIGEAVSRAGLPGPFGKAAAAAVASTVDAVRGSVHTVRIDWTDGKQSVIQLPDRLFQHLAIVLKDCMIASEPPEPQPSEPAEVAPIAGVISQIGQIAQLAGVVPTGRPDVTEQIAKLAALRDQGVLTDEEFAAKKTELLSRI